MIYVAVIIFAIAYAIKGGWIGKIQGWDEWRDSQPIAIQKITGGKFISALLVFVFLLLSSFDPVYAVVMLAAWLLAVSPSMGEEAGAIGRWGTWWGDYRVAVYPNTDKFVFNRSYGVLKGVQRGVWMGAVFTVAGATALSIPIMGLGFVAAHFAGQELYYRLHKRDSWAYSEPMIGALIGICLFF